MTRSLLTTFAIVTLTILAQGCHAPVARDFSGIDSVVQAEIDAGHFPGAVVLVGQSDRIVYRKAYGHEVIEPDREEMTDETLFDLASMTKPIATATSILTLVDQRRIDVNDYVKDYMPAFAAGGKEAVRIKHLLTHTSGLPPYTNANSLKEEHGSPCPDAVIEKICSLEAMSEPGQTFRYSCLGYITLARIVENITGQNIDQYSRAHIFKPLGMKHTTFNPPQRWRARIAATEIVDDGLIRGTVHDPLARLMDGVSGNAGLFSTAGDLSVYCRMLLNNGIHEGRRILSPEAVEMLTTPQSHGRAYGFDVSSSYAWPKGPNASERAFCHTGYTGTSVVCDPETDTFVLILTNRAHPTDGGTVRAVRVKVAEIVFGPS